MISLTDAATVSELFNLITNLSTNKKCLVTGHFCVQHKFCRKCLLTVFNYN